MKAIFYKMIFSVIIVAGLFIGVVKGQEAKQKWVAKKKIKYAIKKPVPHNQHKEWVILDEIEIATYHS